MTGTSDRNRVQRGIPEGGRFAVEPKADSNDLSIGAHKLPQPTFVAEELQEFAGSMQDGYSENDINHLNACLSGVQIMCAWEEGSEEWGFGGDSEILGKVGDGPWRSLSPEFTEYLEEGGPLPDQLLDSTPHPNSARISDLPTDSGGANCHW